MSAAKGVLLLCDMEGASGINCWEHTHGDTALYDEGRRLYTEDVNAAVRGCKAAGFGTIIAHDGHGGGYAGCPSFMNWIPDALEPGAEYVRRRRWGTYWEPASSGEIEAVVMVGAHAMAGTGTGVLAHTLNADGWYEVAVDGEPIGEVGILAALAGDLGVPVVAISGDAAACEELGGLVGRRLVTVPTKAGLGRYAVRMRAIAESRAAIEAGVATALGDCDSWPGPLVMPAPVEITVRLASPDRAVPLLERTGVRAIDARTVAADGGTFTDAWGRIWS